MFGGYSLFRRKGSDLESRLRLIDNITNLYIAYSISFIKASVNPWIKHVTCTLSDIKFTEKDIFEAIDELWNNAASGPDGVAAIFLKSQTKEIGAQHLMEQLLGHRNYSCNSEVCAYHSHSQDWPPGSFSQLPSNCA